MDAAQAEGPGWSPAAQFMTGEQREWEQCQAAMAAAKERGEDIIGGESDIFPARTERDPTRHRSSPRSGPDPATTTNRTTAEAPAATRARPAWRGASLRSFGPTPPSRRPAPPPPHQRGGAILAQARGAAFHGG